MLTQIRERASGWIAWVIVILLTIPFALWGIQSYFEGTAEITVAEVNGEEISLYDYQNELVRRRQALLERSEGAIDPALLNSPELRSDVINGIIINRLINQHVRARNFQLPDELLKRRIETTEEFLTDGEFDPVLYRDLLRASGFNARFYEQAQRQEALLGQFISAVTETAIVGEAELNRLLALQLQTRAAEYAVLPLARFEKAVKISDAEIEQQYHQNPEQYAQAERVKAAYIDLGIEDIAAEVRVSNAELRTAYEQDSERYQKPESRKASHILFGVDETASADEDQDKLAAAEAVLGEVQGGGDFAELAKRHSDDPGSKNQGGDLGVVARGQMVAPFEDAVFDMSEGEVRGPIKTRFGYHLIKLTELTEGSTRSFKEVRDEVAEDVRQLRAEARFAELAEVFENLVFENPDSLQVAADELGLEIKQTEWFTQTEGEDLAAESVVRNMAFSDEVLNDELNSPAIALGFDRLIALRKAEHEPARAQTFDEVREQIQQTLTAEKARQAMNQHAEHLLEQLRDGELTWKKMLRAEKLRATAAPNQRSDSDEENQELIDAIFAHPAPQPDEVQYGGAQLVDGDYAVYALNEVALGNLEEIDDEQRDNLRRVLLERDGEDLYEQLRETLWLGADININREQIERPEQVY